MKNKRGLVLSIVAGILPVLALLWIGGRAKANQYIVSETELNPAGVAFEINPAGDGSLWISDFGGDEIRQINPATGVYTVYQDLPTPSDARPDEAGNVWWTDTDSQLLRLVLGSGQVISWTLPNSSLPLGTAVDQVGNVWVTDSLEPLLFRFNPGTTELCSYAVPDGGSSNYILANGGEIWLSDYVESRIMRLEQGSHDFTMWDLPWPSYVNGIDIDGDGDIWIAESGDSGILAQFDPQINQLTAYTLPVGIWPEMLTLHGGKVWYTEDWDGTVGVLDPAVALGVTSTLAISSTQVIPSCSTLGPGSSTAAATSSSTATWATSVLTNVVDSQGWEIYTMPEDSAPWGITILNGEVFIVDQGWQVLIRVSLGEDPYNVYLPLVVR